MAFILILLMTFMYIFAVAGTVMFASYSKSERTDLKYKQSFRFDIQTDHYILFFHLLDILHFITFSEINIFFVYKKSKSLLSYILGNFEVRKKKKSVMERFIHHILQFNQSMICDNQSTKKYII